MTRTEKAMMKVIESNVAPGSAFTVEDFSDWYHGARSGTFGEYPQIMSYPGKLAALVGKGIEQHEDGVRFVRSPKTTVEAAERFLDEVGARVVPDVEAWCGPDKDVDYRLPLEGPGTPQETRTEPEVVETPRVSQERLAELQEALGGRQGTGRRTCAS